MANMGTIYSYRAMAAFFEQALKINQQQRGFGSEESAACLKNLYLLLHQQRVDIILSENENGVTADSCDECLTCKDATSNLPCDMHDVMMSKLE